MKAGASCRELVFPGGFFPTEGFAEQMDPLYARVLVLEDEVRYALCVLDMTSIPPDEIRSLNAILRERTGACESWVLASHTFSAPHFMPDMALRTEEERANKRRLQELVYTAVGQAAAEAAGRLEHVSVCVGSDSCSVNTARDVETPAGWWIGNNGAGPVDHKVTAAVLRRENGTPAAALIHYPVQSSVLDGSRFSEEGKPVSGDLAGRMCAHVEKELGCPVLFLIGAAGDQAPREKAVSFRLADGEPVPTDMGPAILPALESQAAELTAAVLRAVSAAADTGDGTVFTARKLVTVPGKEIERDLRKLHPTRVPPYVPAGESTQPVTLLRVGGLKLIGVLPELNCVTAREISGGDPLTLVVTLWNGGAKYMADAASCDRITYESQNSPFMKGAAELLTAAARSLLRGE